MKWIEYIANLLFWSITGWLLVSSFSIQGQEVEVLNGVKTVKTIRDTEIIFQIVTCIFVSFMMFYINLYNISKLGKSSQKVKNFLFSTFIFLIAIVLFYFAKKIFFTNQYILPNQISIGIIFFYFTVSSAYGFIKIWILSEQRQKDLILITKQAELNLLRNQLQPHFLFNALNNLLSLVDQKKSPRLSNSIEKLSHLLRYVIEETQSDKTTISKEIQFIKNYCELQSLRFEENELNLKINVKGDYVDQLLEPGLFIPLVENAIKYGAEPEVNSTIAINFDIFDEYIIGFSIRNKIIPSIKINDSTGTGINSLKERLKLVYPEKHQFKITRNEYFLVELKIHTN